MTRFEPSRSKFYLVSVNLLLKFIHILLCTGKIKRLTNLRFLMGKMHVVRIFFCVFFPIFSRLFCSIHVSLKFLSAVFQLDYFLLVRFV